MFVYMGEGGEIVPHDVVRVRVDPSVTSIPAEAFSQQESDRGVELGVMEIGDSSFTDCNNSITKINIPSSLRRINDWAFYYSLRCPIRLHDGIESIGGEAFSNCIFTNFRVPPLITVIPEGRYIRVCKTIFSLELPEDVTKIGNTAFSYCFCLRNVPFLPMLILVKISLVHKVKPNSTIIFSCLVQ